MTPNVITYLHRKGCISRCLAALHSLAATSIPTHVVDVVKTIVGAMRHSCKANVVLLDDMRTCHGYELLAEFLLGVEDTWARYVGVPWLCVAG